MGFMTEKQMDARLLPVSRELVLPSGETRIFTMMQMHWDSVEFANARYSTMDALLRHAVSVAENSKVSLDDALAFVATRLHQWLRDCVGQPLPVEPGVCPLFYKRKRLA